MTPEITKLSEFKFWVAYPEHEPLKLDFEPLHRAAIELHHCQRYVLKHWQAKPRGLRRFGLFAWNDGEGFYSCHETAEASSCWHYDLQIEESDKIPSAALYYPSAVANGHRVQSQPGRTAIWTRPPLVAA